MCKIKRKIILLMATVALMAALPSKADDLAICDVGPSDERAVTACSRIINSNNVNAHDRAVAFRRRGALRRDKGELKGAIDDLDQAVQLNPDDALVLVERGNAYRILKDYDRAVADLDDAVRRQPDFSSHNIRGAVFLEKGDYDRAISDFNKAIEFNSTVAGTFYGRGLAYAGKGDLDSAIRNYDEAVRLDRRFVEAFAAQGEAYLRSCGH